MKLIKISQKEFLETIQEFSREELGVPLDFDTGRFNGKKDTRNRLYFLYVCPKTKFWPGTKSLVSLCVYEGTARSDSLLKIYKKRNYDIDSISYVLSETANEDRKQILPNLSKITAKKISTIFHEGFHYYLMREVYTRIKEKNTITSRSLEEGAATIFGETAARLFIEKYYGPKSRLLAEIKKSNEDISRRFRQLHALYKQLNSVYQDTLLSDAEKSAKAKKLYRNFHRHFGNAGLMFRFLFARHYFLFEGIWQNSETPKEAAEKFIKIIKKGNL